MISTLLGDVSNTRVAADVSGRKATIGAGSTSDLLDRARRQANSGQRRANLF